MQSFLILYKKNITFSFQKINIIQHEIFTILNKKADFGLTPALSNPQLSAVLFTVNIIMHLFVTRYTRKLISIQMIFKIIWIDK